MGALGKKANVVQRKNREGLAVEAKKKRNDVVYGLEVISESIKAGGASRDGRPLARWKRSAL